MKYVINPERTVLGSEPVPKCDFCGNSGYLWTIIATIRGKQYILGNISPDITHLQARRVECFCHHGYHRMFDVKFGIIDPDGDVLDQQINYANFLKSAWKMVFPTEDQVMEHIARITGTQPQARLPYKDYQEA